jgi:prepilin-type N-terminal cleavage/methylation domain-containing protein
MMYRNNKGFTIIESLVAISILVMAVVGAMTSVQTGLSSYIFSKEQIIAFYLAQEGMEQIKNIRDENNLDGEHWLAGIAQVPTDPCFFGEACTVSPVEETTAIRCPSPGSCPAIRQDPDNGFYGYDVTWPETVFRREIQLESVNANEIAATVTIYWSKGIVNRQFRARENILNWQPGTFEP